MAVRGLPAGQKRRAMLIGGAGRDRTARGADGAGRAAVAHPAAAGGGRPGAGLDHLPAAVPGDEPKPPGRPEGTFGAALRTIIIADLTMSLDNMLAVGAAPSGNLRTAAHRVSVLSMAVILAGGGVVALLLEPAALADLCGRRDIAARGRELDCRRSRIKGCTGRVSLGGLGRWRARWAWSSPGRLVRGGGLRPASIPRAVYPPDMNTEYRCNIRLLFGVLKVVIATPTTAPIGMLQRRGHPGGVGDLPYDVEGYR